MQVKDDEKDLHETFWCRHQYLAGSYDKTSDFEHLNNELLKADPGNDANRIFYLALPPSVFEPVAEHLSLSCKAQG